MKYAVNIQSEAPVVAFEPVSLYLPGLEGMAGYWLKKKGCLGKGTDPKQSSFHLSFKLK